MNRCADCKHAHDERDADDVAEGEPMMLRCGLTVPFWVSLPVHDYKSWVEPNDGDNCRAFEKKE